MGYQLQRYVFWETLKVFAMAILVATLIMTLGVGANEGLKRGVPFAVTLQILPFVVPETLRMTVPAALLFSVCTVFGRMAADRELTAAKSLGIHPMRLLMPVFLLGFALSMGTFIVYELCASWARPSLKRTLLTAVDEIAYQKLRSERVLSMKGAVIAVQSVEGRSLISPRLEITRRGQEPVSVEADVATLSEVGESGMLRFECRQLAFEQDTMEGQLAGTVHYDLPFAEPDHRERHRYAPAELQANWLASQISFEEQKIASLREVQRLLATQSSEATVPVASRVERELSEHQLRLHRLRAEYPRRLSNGFAVLAFAMVGIPIAVWRESQDNVSIFFLCMAPIALLYYPLLVFGESIAKSGVFPEYAVWLAPGVLAAVGFVLLGKLFRM